MLLSLYLPLANGRGNIGIKYNPSYSLYRRLPRSKILSISVWPFYTLPGTNRHTDRQKNLNPFLGKSMVQITV